MVLLVLAVLLGSLMLGAGTASAAKRTPSATRAITAGYAHSCALSFGGTVKCWGYNHYGQLGNGSTADSALPVQVSGVSGAIAVTTGYYNSCALVSGGTVKCWGYNRYGQLGDGSTESSSVPVSVSGLSGATSMSTGFYHSCARVIGGAVKCWGFNRFGQLGNGSTDSSSVPVSVSGLSGVSVVSTGYYNSCALSAGAVRCWGDNAFGQLGNGTTTDSPVPVSVSGLSGVSAISTGYYHSCAVSAGAVKCWGANGYGRLGNGSTTDSPVPVAVSGLSGVASISTGYYHSCALSSGAVKCWGANGYGQLGDGSTDSSSVPVSVPGLSTVASISTGYFHSCALSTGGGVKCWGVNGSGRLGDGTSTSSPTPVTAVAFGRRAEITNVPTSGSVGGSFTPAVATSGDGIRTVTSSSPAVCSVVDGVVSYVGGGFCVLVAHVAEGALYAAGDGTAQSIRIRDVPTSPEISNFPTSAAVGGSFVAAVATTGDGARWVTSSTPSVCTVSLSGNVRFIARGECILLARVAAGPSFLSRDGAGRSIIVGSPAPTNPTIANIPASTLVGGSFVAEVATTGDGSRSVTSSTPSTCAVSETGAVTFIARGPCTLIAHVAAGSEFAARDGSGRTFIVGRADPTTPTISNLPSVKLVGGSFVPTVVTNGDGARRVTSSTPLVCTVGLTGNVRFIARGTCTLVAHVAAGSNYNAADGANLTFVIG